MYTCKFFQTQTADHIQIAIEKVLSEASVDVEATPCTTDKRSNMLAATKCKCHISCACHSLSTSINSVWEAAVAEYEELCSLDTNSNKLVKFVKKSGGIQYNLPATLKSGRKTQPWHSSLLTERKREDFIVSIEKDLLEEVMQILVKAEGIFDVLEYSYVPTIQFVLPSFCKLYNFWSEVKPTDSAAGRILRRNLMKMLDENIWPDIVALHVSYCMLA